MMLLFVVWPSDPYDASKKTVKYFSPTTQICVVRVARDHHTIVWGAITLLRVLGSVTVISHVIHLSGTPANSVILTSD